MHAAQDCVPGRQSVYSAMYICGAVLVPMYDGIS